MSLPRSAGDSRDATASPGNDASRSGSVRTGVDAAANASEARCRQLELACELRDRLLAHSSHEIRQPLGSIVGAADWLLASLKDGAEREAVEVIRHSGLALLGIVNDLVDFARIESGALRLELVTFDLRLVLDDALALAAHQVGGRDIELVAYVDEDVPRYVLGDAGRLRQILLNLAHNALRHTHHGHVAIRAERMTLGRKLRFEVSDTGIGVTKDMQERLFMPFAQAESRSDAHLPSSGLGLWICKQLVEQMDGAIGVESDAGRGSTFWFTADLPMEFGGGARPTRFAGQTVLLRERHPLTRRTLAQQLSQMGLTVHSCSANEDALRLADRVDLILLGCSGFDHETGDLEFFLNQLRGMSRTPILIATPRSNLGFPAEGFGIDTVLSKPVREQALHQAVEKLIVPNAKLGKRNLRTAEPDGAFRPQVLVVEDHPGQRRVISGLLTQQGARVATAVDGATAIDLLRHIKVDCVLMDLHMPVMDGVAATRALKARMGREMPPIIGLTGELLPERKAEFLEAGIALCLTKPVTAEVLWTAVRGVLGLEADALTPILDEREALSRTGGDPGLAREVLAMLLSDIERDLPLLRQALVRGESQRLSEIAHTLAGTAIYCGAQPLRKAAAALEAAALAGESQGMSLTLEGLTQAADELRRYAGGLSTVPDSVFASRDTSIPPEA